VGQHDPRLAGRFEGQSAVGEGWKDVEVYVVEPGQEKHKLWRCPECGLVYDSPLPIYAAECGRNRSHAQKQVPMKPEAVLEETAS